MAKENHLQNITFIPFQNRQGVKEILNVTDATFVCYKPVAILETGSPNKYFDGLASGKLIIINFGGWIKKEIEVMKCGVCVDNTNPGDFVKKVIPFVSSPQTLKDCQQASRLLAESKYSRARFLTKNSLRFSTTGRCSYWIDFNPLLFFSKWFDHLVSMPEATHRLRN